MNNLFEVVKLQNSIFDCLLIATTYANPYRYLVDNGTSEFLMDGIFAVDLALPNDASKQRYFYARTKDGRIVESTVNVTETLDEDIARISRNYFSHHQDLLDKAAVPKSARRKILACVV